MNHKIEPVLQGLFPAIPTPVRADTSVDVQAAARLVDFLVDQGVQGIVPLGGTGEYGALARAERNRMAEATVKAARGRVPVIAGILDPGLPDAIAAGKEFAAIGVNALMVVTPYYTTPTQRGLQEYFLRYADASPVPVLIYEIPGRTRIAFEPETLHTLSRHPNIIGMKACNTDMYQFLQVVAGVDDSFSVLSGEDTLYPMHLAAGARGGVLLSATLLPKFWQALTEQVQAGQLAEALRMHRRLHPLFKLLFAETNPGPMKSVMDHIGIEAPEMLLPLFQPPSALRDALRAQLQAF